MAAQSSCRKIYREEYPIKEVQEDFENCRGLELTHLDFSFRYRTCRFAEAVDNGTTVDDSAQAIWDNMETTGEVRRQSLIA